MIFRLFEAANYSLNPLALQTIATSAAVVFLGLFAMIRERGSRVSVVFLFLTLCIGVWLFSFSWMYGALAQDIAFWWAKAGHVGIALIPATCYHFSVLMQDDARKYRQRVRIAWIISVIFLTMFLSTDMLFSSLYRYRWGFYPKHNATALSLFLLFFFFVAVDVLRRFWSGYHRAAKGSAYLMRIKTVLFAFGIGYSASLDFVASIGIPLYPFGYIPVFFFIMLSAYTIIRYRFVDITPALAAPQIIDTMNEALLVLDREGVIRLVNQAACSLFGYSEQELVGKRPDRSMIDSPAFSEDIESFVRRGRVRNYEVDYRARDAVCRNLSMSTSVMRDQSGKPLAIVCVARDVTDRKKAEEELRKERDKAQKYLDVAGVMLVAIDARQIVVRINLKGCEILGYPEEEIVGKNWFDHFIPERIRQAVRGVFEKLMSGEIELSKYYENPVKDRSGEDRIIAWHNTLLRDDAGAVIGTLSSGEDITERKRAEKQIRFLAYYDSLTGLPNRTFYKELLNRALIYAQRHNELLAILFIDLDYFKRINDTLGHDIGDQLLRAVAEVITKCVRRDDCVGRSGEQGLTNIVSRIGGDEFIVLLNEVAHAQDASRVARRIIGDLSRPFTLDGNEVFVSASVGIALYPIDGTDSESLLKNADVAMYHAKTQGRNNCQFYAESMNASALQRMNLENELRKAMERGEFRLNFQPILDVRRRAIIGAEALVLWIHPERGVVSPGEFIPLAEETGLIVPLGEWVLRAACAQNRSWQSAGLEPLRTAVNLSSRQFDQQNLGEVVSLALQESGLDPQCLELEITESTIMRNPEKASITLQQLKKMGIRVSIDDFGTGYSSLAHLRRFPLDTLKIDRSFIMNVTTNSDDAAITTAIIAMAHSLKLRVIAEGVETEPQHSFLRELGCDEAQGYLFSRPVPSEEFIRLVKEKNER